MSGRLITLDNLPGVCTVGVGETWHQLFAKLVLQVTVSESVHGCKDDRLCVGLKVGIDGAVHRVKSIRCARAQII